MTVGMPPGTALGSVYSGKFMPACGRQAAEEVPEAGGGGEVVERLRAHGSRLPKCNHFYALLPVKDNNPNDMTNTDKILTADSTKIHDPRES